VLTVCIWELVGNISWFFAIKIIKENMYSYGRVKISSILNRFLHEFLGFTPAISLTIFFCKVNIFLLRDELPQKIIPYFIIE
jgi:hypothetical protein